MTNTLRTIDRNQPAYTMFTNYLKIAFRNLRKQPLYTLIFISGLAIGLAAYLSLNQYTAFEKSYDTFHEDSEDLYRLTTDQYVNGEIQTRDAMSYAPAGPAMREELPEVINYSTSYKTEWMVFRKQNEPIEELNVIAADSNFLTLFNHQIIAGDRTKMLSEPMSIVLTQSQARKYFGEEDPLGQTIEDLDRFREMFTVTGIIADVPGNTHYHFDILVSLASFQENVEDDAWDAYNYYTFLKLDKNADPAAVARKLPALSKKYMGEADQLFFNLQPVRDIHLHSDFTFEPQEHGSARAVWFLDIISIFILLIAWVNYINLSTAKAVERAKEVGLRKVVGANKKHLIAQFFTESFLINLAGAGLALLVAIIVAPYFNEIVGKEVLDNIIFQGDFLLKLGGFFLLGTLITGFYPAIVLSSFMPITALRGNYGRAKKGAFLRKFLVVVQFSASLLLIASTIIIYKQVTFMTSRELGMNTKQVLGLEKPAFGDISREAYISRIDAFEQRILARAGINAVGGIQNMPGGSSFDINSMSGGIRIAGSDDIQHSTVYLTGADDNYFDVLNANILSGRNFDRELAADTMAFIVNAAFLKLMNVTDTNSLVGSFVQFGREADATRYPVVGVVNDFNRSTLKDEVEPTIFYHNPTTPRWVIKLSEDHITDNVAFIQRTYQEMFPDTPFSYSFLDERFEAIYAGDKRFGNMFLYFSLLAIFVASMGLFGLSSYMALQRTKEVGIRKVLGASVGSIIILFFRDFLVLIIIAVLVGVPLTYLGMNGWLAGYAHRISFPWWVLSLAILSIIGLAFFTVSYQSWRLALLNPTETIRQE